MIRVQHDSRGQIAQLRLVDRLRNRDRILASYAYDPSGSLMQWQDAAGHRSYYEYDSSHRMTRKMDRRGYSYHFRYDAEGRCIHSWGDDGLYEVRIQYQPEVSTTVATFADGATSTFYYDQSGAITEIAHPHGGSTLFMTDEGERVVEEVDPAGNVTKLVYDEKGGHTARVDPLGYVKPPSHIEPNPPDPLAYKLPKTPVEWEYGDLLELQDLDRPTRDDPVLAPFPEVAISAVLGHATSSIRESDSTGRPGASGRRSYDAIGR